MSIEETDAEALYPEPRATAAFFGHESAERRLLDAYRSGRIPHAWLIGGPVGIGKATLAYRMARFVLAHPRGVVASGPRGGVRSRSIPRTRWRARSPARPIPTFWCSSAPRTTAAICAASSRWTRFGARSRSSARRRAPAAGACASSIVADELQYPQASNALLKMLEEPPRARAVPVGEPLAGAAPADHPFALLPDRPAPAQRGRAGASRRGRQRPRCRRGRGPGGGCRRRRQRAARARLAGRRRRSSVRERVMQMLEALPATDPRALHALGDVLAGAGDDALTAFVDTVRDWLSARLSGGPPEPRRLARLAEAWEKVNLAARGRGGLQSRPPAVRVFHVFGVLAEAARG